jgi:hypothetical protein
MTHHFFSRYVSVVSAWFFVMFGGFVLLILP